MLTSLSRFQALVCLCVFVSTSMIAQAVSMGGVDYNDYAELLEQYVEDSGVRYAEWFAAKDDLRALEDVLGQMAAVEVSQLDRLEQKAFYINLYNAGMLQAVFDAYPLKSVKNIGFIPFSVFKKEFIKQGAQVLSLDQIEKEILLVEYFDARIHFAVNCASESCPPLRAEPFVGARLEAQMEAQTVEFANSERAARLDAKSGEYAYSSLFDWYSKDFKVAHPGEYLNRYRDVALKLQSDFSWIPYDWALNAAK